MHDQSGVNNPFYGRKHTDETKEKIRQSKLGSKNAMYGKKTSDEVKRKISISCSRDNLSEDTRRRRSEALRGPKSHLWRGGITEKNMAIRKSVEYKIWRDSVFKRDGYACT